VIEPDMIRDSISQSPRDRILWILTNSGGKMDRSRLRRCAGMRYAQLDPILIELSEERKIKIIGETVLL
jgi:hypothetical protein